MNNIEKLVINIISIINCVIAIILLAIPFITSKGAYGDIDTELLIAVLILTIILLSPALVLQLIKFIFTKLNWNMLVCIVICCILEAFFLLMYSIMSFVLTISPTEPY